VHDMACMSLPWRTGGSAASDWSAGEPRLPGARGPLRELVH
jgi:hypothetical protein